MTRASPKRRPLAVRATQPAAAAARWLAARRVTPNQISVASVAFAALGALCLWRWPSSIDAAGWLLPLAAALAIQLRLLCNLFDGMVAVEGGKSSPSGELFNDVPDRIADPLLLVAAGYAASTLGGWVLTLGWCAALLAVLIAYARILAVSVGAPADFSGPMAKPQRMAVLTAACLLSALEALLWTSGQGSALALALVLIVAGSVVTLVRRLAAARRYLENQPAASDDC